MAELEKLLCTDSKVESLKKINAIIENGDKDCLEGKITNCITEIPQRIKLELNDGVLTLKAGSQVIVPNGFEADGTTPKFDYVTIESDVTYTEPDSVEGASFTFYNPKINTIFRRGRTPQSGTSVPDGLNTVYYNTATNTCHNYSNGVKANQVSFPICICTSNAEATNNIVSIDQVFNGMGYIGSTIWVDKGVKALAPNGRNTDGSLKNYEITTTQVSIYTRNLSGDVPLWLNREGTLFLSAGIAYDEKRNVIYSKNAEDQISVRCQVAMTNLANGVVNSFQSKQAFRAVDWYDLEASINDFEASINDLQILIDREIGKPQISLDSNLPSGCVWLEGSTVSRTTYANLFAIYGTTYGAGDGSTTFKLPDFRNRAIWGSNGFGYLSAGLPNITGAIRTGAYKKDTSSASASGALSYGSYGGVTGDFWGDGNGYEYQTVNLNASKSNAIYGGSTTVQPPAIKVRVYARYQ